MMTEKEMAIAIGMNMRKVRKNAGTNIHAVDSICGSFLSRVENGSAYVSAVKLARFAEEFGTTIDSLLKVTK